MADKPPKQYTDRSKAAVEHARQTIKGGGNPVKEHLAAKERALKDGRTVSGKTISVDEEQPSWREALAALWPWGKAKPVSKPAAPVYKSIATSLNYAGPTAGERKPPPLTPALIALCKFKIIGNQTDPNPDTGHKPGEIGDAVLLVRVARTADAGQIEDIEHSLGEFGAVTIAIKDPTETLSDTAFKIVGDHPVATFLNRYRPTCTKVNGFQPSPGFIELIHAGRAHADKAEEKEK